MSQLVAGILGVKRFDSALFLRVADLHTVPINPLEKTRNSAKPHKEQPSQESAECVPNHVRNARIHSRKVRHTQAAFARGSSSAAFLISG